MRRYFTFTVMALMVAFSTGCHHWQKRPVAPVGYSDCCEPSVRAVPAVTPLNSIAGPPVVSKVLPSGAASPQYP